MNPPYCTGGNNVKLYEVVGKKTLTTMLFNVSLVQVHILELANDLQTKIGQISPDRLKQ